MNIRANFLVAVAASLALAACGGQQADEVSTTEPPVASVDGAESLQISEAWVRVPPPGAPATAGYVTFENRGSAPITVTGLSSEAFGRAEIHDMKHEDGMMRMRRMDTLPLEAGERVSLAPGGMHLMLFDVAEPLADGETVRLEFEFELADGESASVAVDAAVRSR
jgi:copper(I)-binding protein